MFIQNVRVDFHKMLCEAEQLLQQVGATLHRKDVRHEVQSSCSRLHGGYVVCVLCALRCWPLANHFTSSSPRSNDR